MKHMVDKISMGLVRKEELFDFIDAFPALLWRIDIVNNRIEYLNKHAINGLGDQSGLLLQNVEFRRQVVIDEDLPFLESFMEAVKNGKTAATIFRIKTQTQAVVWIKVTGVAYRKDPRYYLGFMLDVTETSEIVQAISEQDAETMAMIEMVDHPVVLINPKDKSIAAHNAAARDLFSRKADEMNRLTFADLYHGSMLPHMSRIYEDLFFDRKWEGRLLFKRKKGASFAGDVVMRHLFCKGMRLFRVSIHNLAMDAHDGPASVAYGESLARIRQCPADPVSNQLIKKIGTKNQMADILKTILDNQADSAPFDAILYSDIYEKKDTVVVYSAGHTFAKMEAGETFSYEGTIAENISRFKLEYLIVDDTFSSIKAIDWALFIPHGIRSYLAKPFYERKVLRTVLIFCSRQRSQFSLRNMDHYAVYDKAFVHGLGNFRKAGRTKKRN